MFVGGSGFIKIVVFEHTGKKQSSFALVCFFVDSLWGVLNDIAVLPSNFRQMQKFLIRYGVKCLGTSSVTLLVPKVTAATGVSVGVHYIIPCSSECLPSNGVYHLFILGII